MSEYIFPTSTRNISDDFNAHVNRTPPSVNPGTDFTCGYDTPVVAVKAGTVTALSDTNTGSGGRYIHIEHGDGTATEYLHLHVVQVSVGQSVAQGEEIALSGGSGFGSDTGASVHLHISLKINGRNVDFMLYVDGASVSAPSAPAASNQDVINRQNFLNAAYGENLTVDGIVGPATTAAIARYQTILGVTADGQWGPATQAAHQAREDAKAAAPAPAAPAAPAASGRATVSNGSTGQDVTDLQNKLNTNYPLYSNLTVDGQFGPATEAVVREFQTRAGLTVDGVAGPATYAALGL